MTQPLDSDLRSMIRRHRRNDILFGIVGILSLLVGISTLLTLFGQLLTQGVERLTPAFFVSFPSRFPEQAGILSAWVGTVAVMTVTAVAAIPLGVASAIYLEEYAPKNRLTTVIEINVTNLAGVPSIVYGLLALGLFVHTLGLGQSILSAGLTLALLILPIVIVSTREALRSVPGIIREAAYALGATRWQMISGHLLPYSTGGIMTGIIMGLSRAIGETAPLVTIGALTFIAFLPHSPVTSTFPFISFQWLRDEFTVMPIQMFNWTSRPEEEFQLNAAAAGVVLLAMTLAMNALAIWLRYRMRKKITW
ncbi:MAG: phosphate ABC transporter permease PstA [Desulfuromonadia bacterium]